MGAKGWDVRSLRKYDFMIDAQTQQSYFLYGMYPLLNDC
jgi:hypothetical protein